MYVHQQDLDTWVSHRAYTTRLHTNWYFLPKRIRILLLLLLLVLSLLLGR